MKHFFTSLLGIGAVTLGANATTWTEVANESQLSQAIEDQVEAIRFTADFKCNSKNTFRILLPMQIDLNGHKIEFTQSSFAIVGDNEVILDDLSEGGNGEMVGIDDALFFFNGLSTCYIKGGTYTTTGFGNCIEVGKYREVKMEGGRINASRYGKALNNKGYFTMNGGTIVGADYGLEPVTNEINGIFTMIDGAVYAGNMTPSVCFENTYWTDGEEEEIAKTILPEGVTDGGAIVLSEQWAIPGTCFINYHLPEHIEIQPNLTHYYTAAQSFALPECNYRNNIAFAGWATSETDTDNLLTEISEGTSENFQLYPVWKYKDLSSDVTPNIIPVSVSPSTSENLSELSTIVLNLGEGDYYINEYATDLGAVYKYINGEKVCNVTEMSTDWDGNVYIYLSETITSNGTYELRIPVNSFGNDDWYYSDMEEGRCNPDLFYTFTVRNASQSETVCVTDPANGTTVTELSTIRLLFPEEEEVFMNYDISAFLTNENGDVVTEITAFELNYDEEADNALLIILPEPITTAGVYTLSVPEGFIQFDWWERDCSAMTFTWTVSPNTSVEINRINEYGEKQIFDIYGRRLDITDPAQLAPGLYIINGSKVFVK